MKTRVIVGCTGAVLVVLALYVFPPIVLELLLAVLCGIAAHEILCSTKFVKNKLMQFLSIVTAFVFAIMHSSYVTEHISLVNALGVMLFLFTVLSFGILLRFYDSMKFSEVAYGYFGGFLIPYLLLSLLRIFQMEDGKFLVLLPLLAAWGADTCAYFTGVFFGKHKLAPVVSPKKTVEGAVGGLIGGAVLVTIAGALLNVTLDVDIPVWCMIILGLGGALLGEIGDLSFSIIKRQTDVKDYGNLLPGHGGVLDRFDSVIFVAPFVEILFRIIW